jgi:hypothetical protein
MGRAFRPERFVLEDIEDGFQHGVGLVCRDCGDVIYGGVGDSLGTGEPSDNGLDRILFVADEHAALYCKGT